MIGKASAFDPSSLLSHDPSLTATLRDVQPNDRLS